MENRKIICISREYGSSGRIVGEKMAEKLGITCYDKKLLEKIAKENGLAEEFVQESDEKPLNWFSMGFPMGIRNPYSLDFIDSLYYSINDDYFNMQAKTIRNIAKEGSCIIIGRAADVVLQDDPDMVSIFIHARKEDRIKTIMARENVDRDRAEHMIRKKDKNRANYYNFYSSRRWGECATYDLSISTSTFTVDGAVDALLHLLG
jgi:cytidylate kinase